METATPQTRVSDEQHVTWLELFFDLVFVAWLSLVNSTLVESPRPSLLLGFDATFVAFTIWMIVTVINNRYPDGGIVRTMSMVLLMMLILVTALTVQPDDGLRNSLGTLMLAAVYVTCAVMLLDVKARTSESRLTAPIVLCLVAAAVCVAGAPRIGDGEGELYNLGFFSVVATLFAAAALVLLAGRRALPDHPIRPNHLDERWGQLIIIVLGEGFLVLAETLLGISTIPHPWLFILLFICVFAFWRLYFDSAMRVPVEENGRILVALTVTHMVLILGLITAFDFLAQGIGIEMTLGDDYSLTGVALGMIFAALAAIAWIRRGRATRVVVVNAMVAVGFVTVGVMSENSTLSIVTFVTLCVVAVLAYASLVRLIDPLARPLIRSAESPQRAPTA
ncbi:MAG: low temperature requirement protein A [Actinobacteria bacterium]|nr:low temperature requirement protein A [Actinomycetota bacterium]